MSGRIPRIHASADGGVIEPGDWMLVGRTRNPWWKVLLRWRRWEPRYARVVAVSGTSITVEEDVRLARPRRR